MIQKKEGSPHFIEQGGWFCATKTTLFYINGTPCFLAKTCNIPRKSLIFCVIAGLTRNPILRLLHEMVFPDCFMKVRDRMRCRVKPGRTRLLQKMPFLLQKTAQRKWTFLLSSPAQRNHPSIIRRIKQLQLNEAPWNIVFHALISVKFSVKMGLKTSVPRKMFHGMCNHFVEQSFTAHYISLVINSLRRL